MWSLSVPVGSLQYLYQVQVGSVHIVQVQLLVRKKSYVSIFIFLADAVQTVRVRDASCTVPLGTGTLPGTQVPVTVPG